MAFENRPPLGPSRGPAGSRGSGRRMALEELELRFSVLVSSGPSCVQTAASNDRAAVQGKGGGLPSRESGQWAARCAGGRRARRLDALAPARRLTCGGLCARVWGERKRWRRQLGSKPTAREELLAELGQNAFASAAAWLLAGRRAGFGRLWCWWLPGFGWLPGFQNLAYCDVRCSRPGVWSS